MIVGQLNMQNDSATKKLKMMIHDMRSPLSCLMMLCNFSFALTSADKESLLGFTDHVSKILNSVTNMDLFLSQMRKALSSFKKYCNQSPRLLTNDKDEIFRYVERMSGVINSSIGQAKLVGKKTNDINIIASVNNILHEKQLQCLGFKIKFLFTKPENITNLHISGSTDNFERMLSNLLNNAVEACSDASGVVSVNLEVTKGLIYLVIEDNGKGIPDNVLQKIRSSISVTSGKEKGQGIGLTQIRETITRLNGKLIIKSEVGRGSKFIIMIDRSIQD